MAPRVMELGTKQYAGGNEIMIEGDAPQLFHPPVAITDTGSDYGDFASDEEQIINSLLGEIAPPSPLTDAPCSLRTSRTMKNQGVYAYRKCSALSVSLHPGRIIGVKVRLHATATARPRLVENPEGREARNNSWPKRSINEEPEIPTTEPDLRSPLERFRRPPKKALSVTDLISPAWCELQYFYTLSKHGRKKRTPAMKQGTKIHKAREDEVHTTVPVDIVTKEDKWGLRIWNVIQGLRTLRDTGRTRELEIWGMVGGEIVNGIVDELSYECPDPKLEAQVAEQYANAKRAKDALPEYQATITEYLLSSNGRDSQTTPESGNSEAEVKVQQSMPPPMPGKQKEARVYVSDIKTRAVKTLPAGASIRPTVMQLHLYHHMLENLMYDNFPLQALADRYELDIDSTFSDSFIVQVGSLNQDFFDTVSEHLGGLEDKVMASQIASSQDSTDLLLRHNTLSSLWRFMILQFQQTFLLIQKLSVPNTPSSTPQSVRDIPTSSTRLSPILTATYLSSKTSEFLGSKSMLFNSSLLKDYLEDNLSWWHGERDARGVQLQEAWKCRTCDFRNDCSWIHERDAAAVAEAQARKKMRDIAGVETNGSKSEV